MNLQRDLDDRHMQDSQVEQALKDFRSSIHAWSEAGYGQPRVPAKVYTTSWRVATGWALGCALALGTLVGGLYQHRHVEERARIAAMAEHTRQQKLEAEQRRQSEELAKIDGDVSREVPSAMEPLAQMMAEDSTE